MNHKTYSELIARQFGGLQKDQLKEKLERLTQMIEIECSKRLRVKEKKETITTEKIVKEIKRYSESDNYESLGSYDKAMMTIRGYNNSGWVHIGQIPVNIFNEFWAITEMHPEIVFDEERDCQYFKVVNFRSRITCSDVKIKSA